MKYAITVEQRDGNGVLYLSWQDADFINSGYFFTTRETFLKTIRNGMNKDDHKFIFDSGEDAEKLANYLHIDNFTVVELSSVPKVKYKKDGQQEQYCFPGIAIEAYREIYTKSDEELNDRKLQNKDAQTEMKDEQFKMLVSLRKTVGALIFSQAALFILIILHILF